MMNCTASAPNSISRCCERCPQAVLASPTRSPLFGAHIMGLEGGFITGSDFLIDGGATADFFYGPDASRS